jgi:hypothetical protein
MKIYDIKSANMSLNPKAVKRNIFNLQLKNFIFIVINILPHPFPLITHKHTHKEREKG